MKPPRFELALVGALLGLTIFAGAMAWKDERDRCDPANMPVVEIVPDANGAFSIPACTEVHIPVTVTIPEGEDDERPEQPRDPERVDYVT